MVPFLVSLSWTAFVENQFVFRQKERFFLNAPTLLQLAQSIHKKRKIDGCFCYVRIAFIQRGEFLPIDVIERPAKDGDELEFRFSEKPLVC
uniref:FERM domain-containing protein n=1 Tax=Steinernema glaseri TaxID=37863 RepID=A0A1I7YIX7_9BILA